MLQPGDAIDIWVIEAALGSGGMGSVYRCHNKAAKRILAAVKVLDGQLKRYPEAEARFIREADILGQLDHPNIVKVRNVRPDADPPYIEMEFVAGESLDERLRRGPMPYADAVGFMRQCAEAVAYLHSKGIRHRDIKPANLLVEKTGRLKLVDFGLAVEVGSSRITQHGVAFGTVSYAPPEWIVPEQLDPSRWDIYALGVVFYELLTGKLAFPVSGQGTARQQAMQVIVAKQGHPPLDPGEAFHDDVRHLIRSMTHSDTGERLADAAEIADRIRLLEPTLKRSAGVTLSPAGLETPFDPEFPARPLGAGFPARPLGAGGTTSALSDPSVSLDGAQPGGPAVRQWRVPRAIQPTTPVTAPAPMSRVALAAFGGIGIAVAAAAIGLGAIAIGAAMWFSGTLPEPTRDLVIRVDGAPASGFELATSSGILVGSEAGAYRFSEVALGPVVLRWVAGPGCTLAACADGGPDCPSACRSGVDTIDVRDGEGALRHAVTVPPPPIRDVALGLSGVPADVTLVATVGGAPATRTDAGLAFAVRPGSYELALTAGTCADDARACAATDACPPGCRSIVAPLVVPEVGEVESRSGGSRRPSPRRSGAPTAW
ncbi:MAG: serine/threonine-protein kinase [Myxococcota bacterium]